MDWRQDRNIGLSIIGLSHRLRRRADGLAASLGEESLTGMQGFIIGYIYQNTCRGNLVFQRDLEKKFGISRSTASGILNLMEKKGLIHRCSVPHDARMKQLLLTEKTHQLREEIFYRMEEINRKLENGLTSGEREQFYSIMGKLNAILDSAENK